MNSLFDSLILAYYNTGYDSSPSYGAYSQIAWYWWIVGASVLASWFVSYMLRSRFEKYSQMEIPLSGKQIAERMLEENGIYDVTVECTPGSLTDHYNPKDKTINLSETVYGAHTVAAAAVAAHECGHAVQHAKAYHWLTMRSALVPIVQLSSNLVQWVLMLGIILLAAGGSPWVLGIGVALFALTTLFAFVTLPVEFDASRRALAWIQASGVSNAIQYNQAKSALFWAAMTYVVGALSSLAMLLYYAMRFFSAMNDRR
ncbi:zinc metallopeptidase [Akkermansia glycaniphila]|uniref:Putative neutral zinc metallopeptidase n=1 Tax=Akkermansia glycaniphila TaxID=1679444 RepID=A0A1H6M756_9BACT|nr:zinc metallopeptidase [Akkermansia glycaniphila]MBT9450423.1 zinc metallopeptidase [Akkermansia glycaniphila]SEH93461.1 putative neutral zinc metallopeptidase [Akkermansia glycaniphila]